MKVSSATNLDTPIASTMMHKDQMTKVRSIPSTWGYTDTLPNQQYLQHCWEKVCNLDFKKYDKSQTEQV